MGKVQSITPEFCEDWYEAITLKQPDGVDLGGRERATFNHAFESYLAGSYDEAYEGFSELSKQDSSVSQYYLGLMYLTGLGVLQDFTQAHMWLNIASSNGHQKARMHLEQLTQNMTADLIAEAQKRARQWVSKKTKEADSAVIQKEADSAVIQKEADSAVIQKEADSAVIQKEADSAVIQKEADSAVIQKDDTDISIS